MIDDNQAAPALADLTDEQLSAAFYGDEAPENPQESDDDIVDDLENDDEGQDSDELESDIEEQDDDIDDTADDDGIEDEGESDDRVAKLDEFLAANDGLRIDTGDGEHTIETLLMRHRDVQIKKQELAEQRKEVEAMRERVEADSKLVEDARAIELRVRNDAAGLGLDAIAMQYPDAARRVAEVLSEYGWSPDKGARAIAEAKLQAVDKKQEPKAQERKGSDVLQMRDTIERTLKHEFTDKQWNAIYSEMEAHESAGDTWQIASEKAISDLDPAATRCCRSSGCPAPDMSCLCRTIPAW